MHAQDTDCRRRRSGSENHEKERQNEKGPELDAEEPTEPSPNIAIGGEQARSDLRQLRVLELKI
jgi:hypothetical protein